jgi:hypothetical protein
MARVILAITKGESMIYHNKKEFVCPYCEKDFKKLRQVKQHCIDAHDKKYKKERKEK